MIYRRGGGSGHGTENGQLAMNKARAYALLLGRHVLMCGDWKQFSAILSTEWHFDHFCVPGTRN